MQIYPHPFWKLDWQEFDYFLQAYRNKKEDSWRLIREIIAAIYNQTGAITSQQARKRNFKTYSGEDIIPLPGDKPSIRPATPEIALQNFKDACKKNKIILPKNFNND